MAGQLGIASFKTPDLRNVLVTGPYFHDGSQETLFPALALVQDDERRLRMLFLRSLHWVAVFSIPTSVGLALLAPELIAVVLGPRWEGAVPAVRVLAGFGLCAALSATTGDVFKATARSHLILRVGAVHSAALWIGLACLASRGVAFAALAVTGAAAVSSRAAFAAAAGILALGPGAIVRALVAPAAASTLMAAAVYVVLAGTTRLVGGALGGAAVYAAALALLAPEDGREVRRLIGALRPAPRGRVSLELKGTGSARTSRDPC